MGIVARIFAALWRRWGDYQSVVAILDLLDLKTAIVALVGSLAMIFIGSTDYSWSAPAVILAAIIAGAGLSIIFIALRLALVIFSRRKVENEKLSEVPLGSSPLICYFAMDDSGCVRPNAIIRQLIRLPQSTSSAVLSGGLETGTTLTPGNLISRPLAPALETKGTYYRIKVSAAADYAPECKGRLEWMRRGSLLLIGEPILLPFAPSEAPDSISKRIHIGAPEYLDFLFISDFNRVVLTTLNFSGPSSISWETLFAVSGEYMFHIKILSPAGVASIDLLFRWTGNRATSEIIQVPSG
jgi:hypothetical protein